MFLNILKTGMFLIGLSLLFLFIGRLVGGNRGMQIALVISLIINGFMYFLSDSIILGIYKAKPLDKNTYGWIYKTTETATQKMGIPMPKLWLIEDNMANAFATGRNPSNGSVALTSGIIQILDKDELTGVISHELAHIKNRDILIATIGATMATAIGYLAYYLRSSLFFRSRHSKKGNPIALFAIAIITPVVATLVQLAISRTREYAADEIGATCCQKPLALASALEKLHTTAQDTEIHTNNSARESTASLFIVNPFSGRQAMNMFSTHPPVHERIKRLRSIYKKMFPIS